MKQIERERRIKGSAVTLQDVAEIAGVHPMTVSNALKGTGRVAAATRENIQRIAAELNYRPNLAARALVTGKTGTIAVVTGPVSEHFYAHLLHLIEIELEASDYKMLFLRSRDLNKDLPSTVQTSAVDGVIAIDSYPSIRNLIDSPIRLSRPCVYAGVMDADSDLRFSIDCIKIDLRQGVRDAVQVMIDSGARRIAYVTSNSGMAQRTEVRSDAFQATLEEAGLTREIINLEIGPDTSVRDLVRERFKAYVRAHGCPEGILCQNDEMAMAVYRGLRDLKLNIPQDVQLVGCDGLTDMEYFDPRLSTIVQPVEEMCALAWKMLQDRLADPNLPLANATLTAKLRPRESLKPRDKLSEQLNDELNSRESVKPPT